MEKVESKKIIREMKKGEVKAFPILVLETVRNNVSLLNTKHYLEGKHWESNSVKERGIVEVTRVS